MLNLNSLNITRTFIFYFHQKHPRKFLYFMANGWDRVKKFKSILKLFIKTSEEVAQLKFRYTINKDHSNKYNLRCFLFTENGHVCIFPLVLYTYLNIYFVLRYHGELVFQYA